MSVVVGSNKVADLTVEDGAADIRGRGVFLEDDGARPVVEPDAGVGGVCDAAGLCDGGAGEGVAVGNDGLPLGVDPGEGGGSPRGCVADDGELESARAALDERTRPCRSSSEASSSPSK